LLLSLEFLFIILLVFFLIIKKILEYGIIILLGIFSSVICIVIFLKFIIIIGCDFVKF